MLGPQGRVFAGEDASVGSRGGRCGLCEPQPSPHSTDQVPHGHELLSVERRLPALDGPQGDAGVPIHEQYNQASVKCEGGGSGPGRRGSRLTMEAWSGVKGQEDRLSHPPPSLLLPLPQSPPAGGTDWALPGPLVCLHLSLPPLPKQSQGTCCCPVLQPSGPWLLAEPGLASGQHGGHRFCLVPPPCLEDPLPLRLHQMLDHLWGLMLQDGKLDVAGGGELIFPHM